MITICMIVLPSVYLKHAYSYLYYMIVIGQSSHP